ncbi:IS200/IS605 family accessory protein TnpB-related protein [Lederbergia sp. NSJ-179]|uniref:IS200/IS605 family accessory protein TnpB-related protein n=1 Tax=Lederbergia sp. NSJ-179 TaxID=2931402 RepID=UPI001FD2FC4C|nr:IS200/IS605 family accessory protein TnpB-related protein [Lederbergia sp. NSJ-179]MCJ7842746.1 IS200/IS605 family accessory protein TnpB-related protein [Lederbergia sp. NSJ-179]
MKELKAVEEANLHTKISVMEKRIAKVTEQVEERKENVRINKATEKQLDRYRRLKQELWQRKQKLNRMKQQLVTYEKRDELEVFPLCWGSKRLFNAQYWLEENGFRSHEGWRNTFRNKRDSQINFVGSKEESYGNQNFQLRYDENTGFFHAQIRKDLGLMINDKDKYIYLENLTFNHHRDILIHILQAHKVKDTANETPLTFRILKRGRKWYLQVIFTWVTDDIIAKTTAGYGAFGFDYNDGFISSSETDAYGNLIQLRHYPLRYHGTGNHAKSEIQQVISTIVALAKEQGKPIVMEDLNFKKTKAKIAKKANTAYNKMIHAFDYSRYKQVMENACHRQEVPFILVNPAYTSQIGMEKYGLRMKLNRHQAASYIIARKGQGYIDRLKKKPKKAKKEKVS